MQTTLFHPTAVVHEEAAIADGVSIGPYAVIGPRVTIGTGSVVGSHACIDGTTVIGRNNKIGRHTCIGADPQDLLFKGEETFLTVGDGNFFGDFSQVCRGTSKSHDRGTHIGNNNFIMAYVHVGHDAVIRDRSVIANAVQIAGHVVIEDHVHIGGLTALHQFIRIGRYAMVAGGSASSHDIPPFTRVAGYGCNVYGLNKIGLERSGEFTPEHMRTLKALYDTFFRKGGLQAEILVKLRADFPSDENVQYFCRFVEASTRGVVRIRNAKD